MTRWFSRNLIGSVPRGVFLATIFGLVLFASFVTFDAPHAKAITCEDGYHIVGGKGGATCVKDVVAGVDTSGKGNDSGGIKAVYDCVTHPFECTAKGIGMLILTIANWLLAEAGFLFNLAVVHLVFGFPNLFGNSPGVIAAWQILRDLGNILLLFGFIFTGVGIILNLHDYNAKKTLPMLIIFALLLNFSLFVSEAVIDTANALSSAIYTQASGGEVCSGKVFSDECFKSGISGRILQASGVVSIFAKPIESNNFIEIATIYIGLSLFVVCTAMVLLAGAILLIIRAITLTLLMVLAPIGFAGMALPFLHKQAEQWWHALISQSFFAPAFLILIFVSLKIMDSLRTVLGTNGSILDAVASGSTDAVGLLILFFLMIGFMIGSLMMAKQLGAYGAETATKMGGGLAFGGLGFIGRRTIGVASANTANYLASRGWARNGLGRVAYNFANKGATSSFDARAGSLGKFAASGSGLDFGKPGKNASHGIHGIEEAAVKVRVDHAKNLEQTAEEKAGQETAEKAKEAIGTAKEAQNTSWKLQKRTLDTDVADKNRALEAAKQSGNNVAIATATSNLARSQKALRDAQNAHEDRIEEFGKQEKELDKQITYFKEAPKRQYADNIEHEGLPFVRNWPLVEHHANEAAKKKIMKEIKKTDNDKLIDAINSSKGGGGGGAAAGGGGGGGGAKPAAKPAGGH